MAVRDTIHRQLTYEDYVLIPEDGLRHEILDGEHYVSPAPRKAHQRVSSKLHVRLGSFVEDRDLGEIYAAPFDVRFSDHDIAQPDLIFISNERAGILNEDNAKGAPDLVVEILSDSTRRIDEGIKRRLYERAGVLEYWLVDPQRRTVTVFRRVGDGFGSVETFSADQEDILTTPLLPGLQIRVGEIFPPISPT
ncbi:MAG TPA: Uma2 family endonuclease [Thermoanaerobaculia bacterium]|nr:Uma2 family endonuclease [Thermoanaerobaculia bacterium]